MKKLLVLPLLAGLVGLVLCLDLVSVAEAAPPVSIAATLDCTLGASYIVPAWPPSETAIHQIENGDEVPRGYPIYVQGGVTNLGPSDANGLASSLTVVGDSPRLPTVLDVEYESDVEDGGFWTTPSSGIDAASFNRHDSVTVSFEVDTDDEFSPTFPGSPPASESCAIQFTLVP